jgi:hypothetical protein
VIDLSFHRYRYEASMERQIELLRGRLTGLDIATLALVTGGRQADDRLILPVFGEPVVIRRPGFEVVNGRTGEPAPVNTQALLLYHLSTTDGAPLTGRWISFRELPDGGFYHQAFQGYTGDRIAGHFRNDLEGVRQAALRLGGQEESSGDAGFRFAALPRVPLLLVYWLGDDEFPPTARILFDASAGHHLPVDACALLGSALTQRLTAEVNAPC